jgi:hypothetical protein
MRRLISLLLTLSAFSTPVLAADLTVNKNILLQKDVLTVGDIFAGLDANKEHVLAPAPQVGDNMTLNADDLQRIASTLHLDWKNDDPEWATFIWKPGMSHAEHLKRLSESADLVLVVGSGTGMFYCG